MVTFETLTVGQYQELYGIQTSDMDDLDKRTESVAVLTGKTNREVEDMNIMDFSRAEAELVSIFEKAKLEYNPKRVIHAGGHRYGVAYEPAKLTAGQYIEVQEFSKKDIVANLHNLMASLSYPITRKWYGWKAGKNNSDKHAEVASDMQQALFIDVWSAAVFFCDLLKNSIQAIHPFLEQQMTVKGISQKTARTILMDLQISLDGFTPLHRLLNTKG